MLIHILITHKPVAESSLTVKPGLLFALAETPGPEIKKVRPGRRPGRPAAIAKKNTGKYTNKNYELETGG